MRKKFLLFSLILWGSLFTFFEAAAQHNSRQTKSVKIKEGAKTESPAAIAPPKEPAHVIGPDGQKVYFLVDPESVKQEPAVKEEELQPAIQPKKVN